jgi:hypothetical protein
MKKRDEELIREIAHKMAGIINRSKYFEDFYKLRELFYNDLMNMDDDKIEHLLKGYERLLEFEEENEQSPY